MVRDGMEPEAVRPPGTKSPVLTDGVREGSAASERRRLAALAGYRRLFSGVRYAGTWIVSVLAFGYFIGWLTAMQYYRSFGAEWVTDLLSPLEFLQWSYGPTLALFVGNFFALLQVAAHGWSDRDLWKADIGFTIAGFALWVLSFSADTLIGLRAAAPIASIAART